MRVPLSTRITGCQSNRLPEKHGVLPRWSDRRPFRAGDSAGDTLPATVAVFDPGVYSVCCVIRPRLQSVVRHRRATPLPAQLPFTSDFLSFEYPGIPRVYLEHRGRNPASPDGLRLSVSRQKMATRSAARMTFRVSKPRPAE